MSRSSSPTRLRYALRSFRRLKREEMLRGLYRVSLLVLAAVFVDLAFPNRPAPNLPLLEEGMVPDQDIIAQFDFPVYKSESELARERAEAAGSVPPIFVHDPAAADSAIARLTQFFSAVQDAVSQGADPGEREDAVRNVLSDYRIAASDAQLGILLSEGSRGRLAASVVHVFDTLLRDGVVSSGDVGAPAAGGVILQREGRDNLLPRDSLLGQQSFYQQAASRAPADLGVTGLALYQRLLIRFFEPTIRLDRPATEAARAQARQAVDPVKQNVLKGERIVAAHERVGPEEVERLRAYRDRLREMGLSGDGGWLVLPRLGNLLYSGLLLLILGLVLRYFRNGIYESNRSVTLLWLLLLAVAGVGGLIAQTGSPAELIPLAFAALVVAALYDGVVALLTVFVITALVVGRPPLLSMSLLFFTLVGGCAAALSGRLVRRRAQTWSLAAVITAAYVLAAISVAFMLQYDIGWVLKSSLWGLINAVGSTLLAMGILPLAESFTGITTDQTLLELADLNRPLLRRLSLEAPGTYAHSINVANLAEAAAREIGANGLLVRVGVYYHDIGKIRKPQYFVENQPRGRNPHDKLKPAMSASIVREHVEEGLALADEAGLPDVVKRFITEHHGTQRIGFFYERAREMSPEAELDPDEFRYPGPQPASKETAIALLADSVESAARALQDPTPEKIEEVVGRIVDAKLSDGQMDRAPLTLREVSTIKEQFVKVLTGMYHHRLDYPQTTTSSVGVERSDVPVARGAPS